MVGTAPATEALQAAKESKPVTGPGNAYAGGAGIASAIRWGWYSIAVDFLLVVLLGIIATVSGSLAVGAELIHNAVDLVAAGAVLAGLKIAERKSTVFPYGLYKVENAVAAAIGGMIFFTAFEIAHVVLFGSAKQPRVDGRMLAALAVTLIIPLVFSHFELRAANAANSPALVAQAREYRIHAYTTGLAFTALISSWFGLPADRLAALLIMAAVVKTGWELLSEAMRVLLDASLDADRLNEIRQAILADPAVAEVKWITGRNAGRFRFVEAGVALRVTERAKAEAVLHRVETSLHAAIPQVERALLHIEARTSSKIRYAIPLADLSGTISEHFGEAPYFAFVMVDRAANSIAEHSIQPNPYQSLDKGKGIKAAEWLTAQKADIVLAKVDLTGRGPGYVLRDAGIEVRQTGVQSLADALGTITI